MMPDAPLPGNRIVAQSAALGLALAVVAGGVTPSARHDQARPAAARPATNYWVYAGAESADLIHRIRFSPDGMAVERTTGIGELSNEMEGPHGLAISADGKYLYMTTGHGRPDGKLWKYELGEDKLIGEGLSLGMFPASLDITPDGLYSFSVDAKPLDNIVPSTVSVVYTPRQEEVARIVTCTMPHGSRIDAGGRRQYSTCMMDDQLVEIDVVKFEVARRFSVAKGKEGPIAVEADPHAGHAMPGAARPAAAPVVDPAEVGYAGMKHDMTPASCSPTWAQPSIDGRKIFVACNKADEILEIDRDTWTLGRRLPTGRGVYNLGVTPDGRLLVATLKQGSMFEIFDIASGKSLARLKTSTTLAHGVAVSPDSRYAFVTSEGVGSAPGKVDAFDLRTRTLAGTVDVGQQASGIAFWRMGAK